MRFNTHSRLEGQHASLSPSKYHWINYDEDKFDHVFRARLASQRGTQLHALAMNLIRLGVRLPDIPETMNLYVNDAIGFKMSAEVLLYYSDNAFGTCDAISFRDYKLRIHDLKTGLTRTSEKQLLVYAALFCLEYQFRPTEVETELRIYQNDEIAIFEVDPTEVARIMDRIISFDKRLNQLREELPW